MWPWSFSHGRVKCLAETRELTKTYVSSPNRIYESVTCRSEKSHAKDLVDWHKKSETVEMNALSFRP